PLDVVARYGGGEVNAQHVGGERAPAGSAAGTQPPGGAALKIAHSASTTRPCVTVSVGVSTVEPGGEYSHEHAVHEADTALYVVKERGRNGWSFHEPAPADGAVLKAAR